MADITIGYKGETIAEISASGTTTIGTSGKYCEDNITLQYVRPSAPTQNDDSIYLLRALPYTSYLKQLKKIIGGSVAWNQLANNGSASVTSGHKYISCSSGTWSIGTSNGTAISADMVFDITLMFGSTIADYIYGLGSASCVAWFRHLFPSASYPSDAGSLLSVKTSAHKMVGFNQWDEEYLFGYYKNDGAFLPSTSGYFSSKNKIPVIPSTSYHIKVDVTTAVYICYYDGNGTFVERVNIGSTPTTQRDFTTPSYCCFINFSTGTGYGTTYNHDICINISDASLNGTYQPYCVGNYLFDSTIELRGILKLDANNNLYYDGDEYTADGTVKRKYEYRAYASGDESLADAITDGTHTVVKLSTPTTETATPYIEHQACFPNGTEQFVDGRTVEMPVEAVAEYEVTS